MSEIWHVFGKGELQELIGLSTLERLGVLLPALMKDGADPDVIHYKETLCRIFESFAGPAAFLDREFRHRFLNHLTSQQIDRLIRETGTQVSGQGFEEKVSALVARGWSDPGFCEKVAACLGLPEEFVPHLPSQVPSELVYPAALRPFKTLKDYQSAVFHVAEKRMAAPNARFVLQMPTGSGKTRTAMELVTQLLNRADERTVVVWLAHAKELCEQAYECFLEVWGHVGASPVRVLRCWGPNSALTYDFNDKALVIGGFQKLQSLLTRNAVPFDELRNRVALIVVDEAHIVSEWGDEFRPEFQAMAGIRRHLRRRTIDGGHAPGPKMLEA